jgi:hypothetical protein
MKRILFNLFLSLLFVTALSCNNKDADKKDKEITEGDVPATVKTAFSAKYSTATDIKWEDAHEGSIKTYKAKFTIDGKKMKAEFDGTGKLIKEENN